MQYNNERLAIQAQYWAKYWHEAFIFEMRVGNHRRAIECQGHRAYQSRKARRLMGIE